MPNQFLSYWNLHKIPVLLVLLGLGCYLSFAYDLARSDFIKMATLFTALFFITFTLIRFEKWNLKFLFVAGILFRLAFLGALPSLSQDYYRFVWDGQSILQGINPYLFTPDELIARSSLLISQSAELHAGMGSLSASHFSNYPPLNQLLFAVAALLGGKTVMGSVFVMRVFIIIADIAVFYYGRKLLRHLNRSPYLIFWYYLNPLVIIELTGNLHFEGVMLGLFIGSLSLLSRGRWIWAAVLYSLSIGLKLIPLMFLPLFLPYLGYRKSIAFYSVCAAVLVLLLLPFYTPDVIGHFMETNLLWFSNFEFNAGVYNLVKKIAIQFDVKPWKLIKTYGLIYPVLIVVLVGVITFFRKKSNLNTLLGSMLWILSAYYFLASTVHPWYLIFLVLLCIYTDFRYPLWWSVTAIFSYLAYSHADFGENLPVLFLEYFIVFGFLGYEIIRLKGSKFLIRKN